MFENRSFHVYIYSPAYTWLLLRETLSLSHSLTYAQYVLYVHVLMHMCEFVWWWWGRHTISPTQLNNSPHSLYTLKLIVKYIIFDSIFTHCNCRNSGKRKSKCTQTYNGAIVLITAIQQLYAIKR